MTLEQVSLTRKGQFSSRLCLVHEWLQKDDIRLKRKHQENSLELVSLIIQTRAKRDMQKIVFLRQHKLLTLLFLKLESRKLFFSELYFSRRLNGHFRCHGNKNINFYSCHCFSIEPSILFNLSFVQNVV